jgi:hypothetical protein
VDLKQIISDAIDNVSYRTSNGMVDLRDAYHLHEVQMELKKHIDESIVETVLYEKDNKKQPPLDDASKTEKEKLGLVWKGQGYGKENEDGITHKNDGGKLVKVEKDSDKNDDEKGNIFKDKEKDSADAVRNKDYNPQNADWQPEGGNQEKAVKRTADKLRNTVSQIPFESEEDEAATNRVISNIENGEAIDPKDAEAFNKYVRIKETGGQSSPEFAFYISNTAAGDFRQGRRVKVEMGTGQNGHMVRRKLEAQGIQASSASTTSGKVPPKLSGKIMTMTKIAQDKGGGIVKHKVKKTRNADGQIESVTVGGRTIKRIPEPDRKELEAQGMSEKDINKKLATIKRNNKMVDQYENIDQVEEARLVKGADTSTKEGREKTAKEGPAVMADSIRAHMEKAGPLTKAEEVMLDRMKALGDIEDPEEYEKEAMKMLSDMQKIESMRKGVPDVAEAIIMCVMNKKGLDCVAPAGETYKVADLIVFPPKDNPEDPNSAEYIVFLESTGGLSVKWKGGAASGARAKVEVTAFKSEETQGRLINILDLHNNFMGTAKQPLTRERIDSGKAELDKEEQWARQNGMLSDDDFGDDGSLIIPGSKGNRTTKQWANDSIADWQSKGKLPPDCTPTLKQGGIECLTKENKALLVDSLDQYCRGGIMLAKIHNKDLEYQPYGNANGTADELELSNGIDCVNHMHFQPNPGFDFTKDKDGNNIVRPNAVYAGHLEKVCD